MTASSSVSIVLVTYNRAAALVDTLESVMSQTWEEWELLVCDDASTDGTRLVIAEFARRDPRIRYLGAERNLGMPGNLNRGLKAAMAPLIAIMHDGDVYHRTVVEKWRDAMLRSPRIALAFNGYRAEGPAGSKGSLYVEGYPNVMRGQDFLESVFFRRWSFGSPVHGTAMVRKSALEAVGYPDPRFRQYADVDLWMRLCEQYDVAYIDEPLIDLASRERLPQDWGTSEREGRILARRAFAAARARHYADRPVRRLIESLRHVAFSVAHETYYSVAELKNRVFDGR